MCRPRRLPPYAITFVVLVSWSCATQPKSEPGADAQPTRASATVRGSDGSSPADSPPPSVTEEVIQSGRSESRAADATEEPGACSHRGADVEDRPFRSDSRRGPCGGAGVLCGVRGDVAGGGEAIEAFQLLSDAIAARPSRRELRLLRAAVALDGFGELARPVETLGGAFTAAAKLDLSTILFVLDEYQETFPERPPRAVPWSGLYHPYVFEHAVGPGVRLWSHGLRPLLRANALVAGDLEMFDAFGGEQASLVETVLSAQLHAVRGDAEAARETLRIPLEKYVGRQYVVRWRSMLSALEVIVAPLSTASDDEAERLS